MHEYTARQLGREINDAKNLYDLLDALRNFERHCGPDDGPGDELAQIGVNIAELPRFTVGLDDPMNRMETDIGGVWSWDEDQLLVGEGSFFDWEIVDRSTVEGASSDPSG